jgi:hypothetical protein
VEAQAQMKYHHSERCFTYRMKRPMVFLSLWLRAFRVWEICESIQTTLRWLLRQSEDPTVVRTAPTSLGLPFEGVLFRDICQMGSLAGAAYLLHDNAGVPRRAQWEQKSHVAHKRKSSLD